MYNIQIITLIPLSQHRVPKTRAYLLLTLHNDFVSNINIEHILYSFTYSDSLGIGIGYITKDIWFEGTQK